MAEKISQMTPVSAAQLTDLKEVTQSGATFSESNQQLLTLFTSNFYNANVVTHDLTALQLTNPLANIQVITMTNNGTVKLPVMNGQTPAWKGRSILIFNNGDQNVTGATEFNIYAQDGTTLLYGTLQYQKGVFLHCTDDSTSNGTFTVTPIPNLRFRRFIQEGGAIDSTFLGCICEATLSNDAYTAPLIGTVGMYTGFNFILKNNSSTNITFTPTSPNTIDGLSVLTLAPQEAAWIVCNGSAWETISINRSLSGIGSSFFNANVVTHDATPLQLTQPLATVQSITLTNTGTLKLPTMNGQTPGWKGRGIVVFNSATAVTVGATEYNIYAQDGTTLLYGTLQFQQAIMLYCTDDSTANGSWVVVPVPNYRFRRFIQDGGAIDSTFLGCVCEASLPNDAYTAPLIGTAGMVYGFNFILKNNSTTNITFTPTSPNKIDGQPVLMLAPEQSAWIFCNGSVFFTIALNTSIFSSLTLQQPSGFTGANAISQVAGVQTTNATQTVLASVVVNQTESITLTGTITGAQSDHTNAVGGNFTIVAHRASGGNVTLVGSVITNVESSSAATFTCGVDTGTQTVRILVTGIAATTYNWVSNYTYQKVLTNT